MRGERADRPDDETALTRCRELLREEGDGLSDDELEVIREHADLIAHAVLDLYRAEHGPAEQPM